MISVNATPKFMRLSKKLITEEAQQDLIDFLALNPEKGTIISGSGGIRKIRWITGKGSGKRGGIRALYYYDGDQTILLISLFKKAAQEDINSAEKNKLRNLINDLFGE